MFILIGTDPIKVVTIIDAHFLITSFQTPNELVRVKTFSISKLILWDLEIEVTLPSSLSLERKEHTKRERFWNFIYKQSSFWFWSRRWWLSSVTCSCSIRRSKWNRTVRTTTSMAAAAAPVGKNRRRRWWLWLIIVLVKSKISVSASPITHHRFLLHRSFWVYSLSLISDFLLISEEAICDWLVGASCAVFIRI